MPFLLLSLSFGMHVLKEFFVVFVFGSQSIKFNSAILLVPNRDVCDTLGKTTKHAKAVRSLKEHRSILLMARPMAS